MTRPKSKKCQKQGSFLNPLFQKNVVPRTGLFFDPKRPIFFKKTGFSRFSTSLKTPILGQKGPFFGPEHPEKARKSLKIPIFDPKTPKMALLGLKTPLLGSDASFWNVQKQTVALYIGEVDYFPQKTRFSRFFHFQDLHPEKRIFLLHKFKKWK